MNIIHSDLPGGEQATKGDKQLTVIYYMDYSPLSNIRQFNEMGVADSLLGYKYKADIITISIASKSFFFVICLFFKKK